MSTLPGDPLLVFMKVPEGKITSSRVHLDWLREKVEAGVTPRLGRRLRSHGLRDPQLAARVASAIRCGPPTRNRHEPTESTTNAY
jgi:hypothetical protein